MLEILDWSFGEGEDGQFTNGTEISFSRVNLQILLSTQANHAFRIWRCKSMFISWKFGVV